MCVGVTYATFRLKRQHCSGVGSEEDMHEPHWYGSTVLVLRKRKGFMNVWIVHCLHIFPF